MLDESQLSGAVGQLLDQTEETFHLRNLTVFHDQQLLLIESGGEELVPDSGDRGLGGPESKELIQVQPESEDDHQHDAKQDEQDFRLIQAKFQEIRVQD